MPCLRAIDLKFFHQDLDDPVQAAKARQVGECILKSQAFFLKGRYNAILFSEGGEEC